MTAQMIGIVILSYLLGAIPVGVFAARLVGGTDPRWAGSRNIGFTNVLRVAGKTAGALTLLGDMGKGALAVICARLVLDSGATDWGVLAAAAAAILGHVFSIFLHFHGGKGVATALGAWLAIDPIIGGVLILVWLTSLALWRTSSLAAIMAFGSLPVLVWIRHPRPAMLLFAVGVSAVILYRHAENIRRLRAGTEPKLGVGQKTG
jgi:acyl phosphate:glycerol-3-phosphate acyltransferase